MILATVSFLIALSKPQTPVYLQALESVFHNWFAMAMGAMALWIARRKAFGPLPIILRGISGLLLSILVTLTLLGLLIWPPLWEVLGPFGVLEKQTRLAAIQMTMVVGVIGCALTFQNH